MTRPTGEDAMSSEHVEVLRVLRDRWASPDERVALDAAIASLSAPQPPAEALRAEREVIVAQAVKYADKSGRLEAKVERLAEALRLIASPKRPDGTWNRDREACRQIAENALRDHDQEGKDG